VPGARFASSVARLVHAQAHVLKQELNVDAARCFGADDRCASYAMTVRHPPEWPQVPTAGGSAA